MALEGFKVYVVTAGVPSVTFTKNGTGLSKAAVAKLGNPEYVRILFDSNEKRMAVQACDENEEGAVKLPQRDGVEGVRWNNKDLINTVEQITGFDIKGSKGFKVDGITLDEERAILFELQKKELI
mgnify:FL=1